MEGGRERGKTWREGVKEEGGGREGTRENMEGGSEGGGWKQGRGEGGRRERI